MSVSIRNPLKNASIRFQINLIILVALLGFALTGFLYYSGYMVNIKKENERNIMTEAKKLNDIISYNFLNARRNEKDFLLRLDEESIKKHAETGKIVHSTIEELRKLLTNNGYPSEEVDAVENSYTKYETQFSAVVKYWNKIGLNKDSGLQGDFYKAADDLEKQINTINDDILKNLYLKMRISEKDFMHFLEYDYIEAVENQTSEISKRMNSLEILPEVKESAVKSLNTYLEKFLEMSDLRDNIVAQTKKLSTTFAEAQPILDEFSLKMTGIADEAISKAKTGAEKNYNLMIAVITLASLLVCVLSAVIGRGISGPIKQLSSIMKRLAEGKLELEIPFLMQSNETGNMAKALQVFKENAVETEKLKQDQIQQDIRAAEEKKKAMRDLAESFDSQVSGLINSLASASTELQSTAQSMKEIADKTAQVGANVASSTQEASANVSTVASAMEEMSASSGEIAVQVTSAKVKSNDTSNNAKHANVTVGNLSKLVDNIGEVVFAIKDIAEQTNLLALNATIEAARAGDAGKGFAVVADEVKKLANETALKTGEIESRIAEIQGATKNSVDVMERIIANISEIDQSVTGVSAAVEEQNATTSEISRSVSEASAGVQDVARNIIEVQTAANETGSSADTVLIAAQEVSKLSENLKISVDQFLNQIKNDNSAEDKKA